MAEAEGNGGREPLFSLKIGGIHYRVVADPGLIRDDGADGQVRYSTTEITVDESLSEEKRLQVLFHEAIHCLLHHAGAGSDVFVDGDACERAIDVLSHGMIQLLRDNPVLGVLLSPGGDGKEWARCICP